MVDRDALVKALYCRKTIPENPGIMDCENCPYYQKDEMTDCDSFRIYADSYALLKDRESEVEIEGSESTWWFVCDECHTAVDTRDKYCRSCGRKLVWREM